MFIIDIGHFVEFSLTVAVASTDILYHPHPQHLLTPLFYHSIARWPIETSVLYVKHI